MRSNVLVPVAFTLVSTTSAAAFADSDCASNAWFCDREVVEEAAAKPATEATQIDVSRPVVVVQPDQPVASPAPVVIIIVPGGEAVQTTPPPAPVVKPRVVHPPYVHHRPARTHRPAVVRPKTEWIPEGGFDIRVERLGFDSVQPRSARNDASSEPGLWGGGMSLRFHYRPEREIMVGNGFLFGNDMNGLSRGEVNFQVMGLRHFNPNRPLGLYGLGGVGFYFGSVTSEHQSALTPEEDTTTGKYFAAYGSLAAQGGVGIEWRFSKYASINTNLVGLLRWRFKSTQDAPEYFDPDTGEARNFFPGIMLRTGISFWQSNKKDTKR